MVRPISEGSPIDLIFEEHEGSPRLYAEDEELAQILRNFISNAVKFTPQGVVRVSARMENPQQVRFAVSDTGIGIAPELHDRLFEDFAQVDSPLQKRLSGTGLGLAITQRIIQGHDGHIHLESTPGQGSSFTLCLPISMRDMETEKS